MKKANVFDLLKSRGFVFDTSDETGLKDAFNGSITVYQGFDPSADSLHLGHLMSLIALHHMQEAGHKVIFLLGGGTGRVGDPSGKSAQRNLLTRDIVEKNALALKKQVEQIGLLRFSGDNAALMLNNDEWLGSFKFLEDFLIKVARYFSVNELVSLRTFSERLSQGKPLSLLEFCYPALQAWDYLELNSRHNCTLQVGGQDQWANILAGVDLIRKAKEGTQVFAFTFPLLTTSDGVKMGKTEKGPVWLDATRTTPFEFYQYLVKTPDDTVPNLLRLFTFIPLDEIEEIVKQPKEAQKRLAFEVTKLVHGLEAANAAAAAESMPELSLGVEGLTVLDALIKSGGLTSNSEVRRRVEQGGVYLDDTKVTDINLLITKPAILKYGKGKLLRLTA